MPLESHETQTYFCIIPQQKSFQELSSEEKRMLASGGWKCPAPCNKIHPSYETSCSCGKSKWDV